jgi:colanic acid/amylovoran biosynthesis glycosyltransferase
MSRRNGSRPRGGIRLAYLVTHYPGLSHSFVQREVEALRARGLDIHTFAIHDSDPNHVFTQADRDADRSTFTVFPLRWGFLFAHLWALLTGPGAYLRTLSFTLRRPPGAFHGRLWKVFYFLEAVPIWRECSRRGLTHVHAHFTNPSGDVAQIVARLGVERDGPDRWSWSFSAHGTDIFNDGPGSLAGKVETASLVISISDFGRSQLMRLAPEDHWHKVRVARCGLNGEWLTALQDRENGAGTIAPDGSRQELRLLSVGRLEREKGHSVLLDAVAALKARGIPVRLELVGDGTRLEALKSQARRLAIEDLVNFAGPVGQDRIRDHYRAADVFCLPSLGEGIPVVLMEALACGLPAIASNTMGIPELIEDGVTGLLVPAGRSDALADGIERLARDPALRARLRDAGRRKVIDDYDLDRGVDQLRDAFQDLLAPEMKTPLVDG